VGVLKFPQLGLLQLWGPITLRADLRLRWGLKQSYSLCQKIFNNMSHATWTPRNQGDSGLLVVGSQIANLTPSPSLGYILCVKCPNGSCEPILTSRFQDLSIDIINSLIQWVLTLVIIFWKFGSPLGLQLPKWELTWEWGFIPSHSLALPKAWNVIAEPPSWPAPSQALALVTSPRLGLQHFPTIKHAAKFIMN